jgi:hypothetical protein
LGSNTLLVLSGISLVWSLQVKAYFAPREAEGDMGRKTFVVIDLVEILTHKYAGRPEVEVARSFWGVNAQAMRLSVAAAAGLVPGGPAVSEEQWRRREREWFPVRGGFEVE